MKQRKRHVIEAVRKIELGEYLTVRAAAKATGIPRSTLYQACECLGVESYETARRRERSVRARSAARDVRRGMSVRAAARAHSVSPKLVASLIPGASQGRPRRVPLEEVAAIWPEVLVRRVSAEDLGRRWGVTGSAVRHAARKLGLAKCGCGRVGAS